MEVTFKFLVVGLLDLAHKYGDFSGIKEELEVDASYTLANKVNLDIEDVFPAPHGTGGVLVIIYW